MNQTLLFIRASAGSGKTYRLSTHYLKLLLDQPDPGKILATTFTRAAAGEILARVLKRLAEAVVDPDKLETLAKDIGRASLTQADCSSALERLTAALHRVNIGTMDSFFSKIARSLPNLMDLPHKWSIASDSEDELLSSQIIHQMAKERLRFSKAWKAFKAGACRTRNHEEMLGVLRKIRFLELAEGKESGLGMLRLSAKEAKRWQGVVATLPCAVNDKGKEYADFRKAITTLLGLLVEGTPLLALAETEQSRIVRHLLAPEVANCPGRGNVEMPTEWAPALGELLAQIRTTAQHRHALRQFGLKELKELFAPLRMEASLAAGKLTFEEVMQTVKNGVQWNDGTAQTDLYFHLDCKIDHILFDEFQDTSVSQYDFFRPLVENIAAGAEEPRSVFVVGDPKQAIYGWRGGDRNLIDSFEEDYPGVKPENLNTSYRSSPVVLAAVDRIFQGMHQLAGTAFKAPFQDAVDQWMQSYQPHLAKHSDLRGEVNLWCLEDKAPEAQQQAIVERVLTLIQEKQPAEVAILLRRTKWIPSIIDALRRQGIDAAPGPSGNFITDSLAVEIILAAITFIDHPHRNSAAAHLASHACWASALAKPDDGFWQTVRDWTHVWYTYGAGELIARWIRDPGFASALSEHDLLRCGQLLALSRRFDTAGAGRPDQFVEAARNEKKPGGRPAKVRVMTIHASKGLEFESVVLGDLGFVRGGGMALPGFESDADGELHVVETNEVLAACIGCETGSEALKVTDIMGELSLLYVGLTRARSYLDVVIPTRGKTSKSFSNASLLELLLAEKGKVAGEHQPLGSYSASGSKSWAQIAGASHNPTDSTRTIPVAEESVEAVPPLFERKSPSGQEGGEKLYFRTLHGKSGGYGKKIGTAYHAWLAQIEWQHDCRGTETVEAILDATPEDWTGIPRKEAQALLSRLLDKISGSHGSLAQAFDKGAYAKKWNLPEADIEAWRERAFAVPVKGKLWSGRFDRVVVGRSAEGTHFDIIDFKSDLIRSPEERTAKEAFYSEQLKAYRKVLSQMAGDKADISTSLVFLNEP